MKGAIKLEVQVFESSVLWNKEGKLSLEPLPLKAQLAPVYAIETGDFNNDGTTDILLGGNQYRVKPEIGRYDASYGTFLSGNGNGNLTVQPSSTGWMLDGEVRDIVTVNVGGKRMIVVARSNAPVVTLSNPR